jgi:hypothetical protein
MSGLKKDMGAIQRAVQILAGTYDKDLLSFEVAKVTAVDTKNWLCTADLVSGTTAQPAGSATQNTYSNIQLSSEVASNGFIQVPKINSNVILAITWRNEAYVFMCSEVDALVFHQLNPDNSYEEFVINCNSSYSPSLPLGIQLMDGAGNGVSITSGSATATNNNGKTGIVISAGTGKVTNDANGITISNSSASLSNKSNGILISCSGTMQFNDGTYKGIPIAQNVANKILALETRVNNLLSAFNTHTHSYYPGPTTPAPGGVTTVPVKPDSDQPINPTTSASDLENTDITHGPKVA